MFGSKDSFKRNLWILFALFIGCWIFLLGLIELAWWSVNSVVNLFVNH